MSTGAVQTAAAEVSKAAEQSQFLVSGFRFRVFSGMNDVVSWVIGQTDCRLPLEDSFGNRIG